MRGQQEHLLELAGVKGKLEPEVISVPGPYRRRATPGSIEVFFRDDAVLFLVNAPSESAPGERYAPRAYAGLEVNVVGSSTGAVQDAAEQFADDLEAAIRATVDGRRTRHMEFEWSTEYVGQKRLDSLCEPGDGDGPSFRRATLVDEELVGALALADENTRRLARMIAEAAFLRETDLLEGKGKRIEDAKAALQGLRDADLLSVEYLLQCRKTSAPLGRFSSREEVSQSHFRSVRCPSCSQSFADELLTEGYSLSDVGRTLVDQSHWMTVWVTKQLVDLGVPLENILWNLSEAGEEVDLVVEILNQLWIFELKDRDFGSGDAHPFNYRQVRFGAQRALIITTGVVQKDAKRVFEDLAAERRLGPRAHVVYVEGLENTATVLNAEMDRAAINFARWQLGPPGEAVGFDLGPILAAKFSTVVESAEDGA